MKPTVIKSLADLEHPVGTAFEIRSITKLPPARSSLALEGEAPLPLGRCLDVLAPTTLNVLFPVGTSSDRMHALRVFAPGRQAVLNLAVDTPDRREREAAILLYGLLHAAQHELLLVPSGSALHGIGLGEYRGTLVLQGTPTEVRTLLCQLRFLVEVAVNDRHTVLVMESDRSATLPLASEEAQEIYTGMLKPRFDELGPFALIPVDLWGEA